MKRFGFILMFVTCAFIVKAQRYDNGIILQSLTDTLIRSQPMGTHITLLDSATIYVLETAQISGTSLATMIAAGDAVKNFNDRNVNITPLATQQALADSVAQFIRLNQTSPQTIINGIPLLEELRVIDQPHQLVDAQYVQEAITSIGVRYYMLSTASGVGGYYNTQITPSLEIESSITATNPADGAYIAGWISPSDLPISKLVQGHYEWDIFADKNSVGNKQFRLYWTLVERLSNGTEVVIDTSTTSNLLQDFKTRHRIPLTLEDDYEFTTGSRIVGKLYARYVSGSSATDIVIYSEGTSDSHWETSTNKELLDELYIQTETDPVFEAWDKSTGISIPASQVSDFDVEVSNNTSVAANTGKDTTGIFHTNRSILNATTASFTTVLSGNIATNNAKVSYPGSASSTELNYLIGVTANVQTQLNGKQATLVSGTNIKTINSESLLGSGNIVVTGGDVSGKADTTWVHDNFFHQDSVNTDALYTAAEVDALRKVVVLQSYTANTTLVIADAGKTLLASHATALSITVPPNSSVAFPVGSFINAIRTGAGTVSFVAGSGVTINSEGDFLSIAAQNAAATLVKTATDTWYLIGRLE